MTERAERMHRARQLRITDRPIPSKLDQFRCTNMGAWLTREACGKRHERASRTDLQGGHPLDCGTCARCDLGAQHLNGAQPSAWPDGAPVETRSVAVARLARPLLPGARTIREDKIPAPERKRRDAATYEYKGRSLTIAEWAQQPEVRALGISKTMLKNRLSPHRGAKRMPIERALTQPPATGGGW